MIYTCTVCTISPYNILCQLTYHFSEVFYCVRSRISNISKGLVSLPFQISELRLNLAPPTVCSIRSQTQS